MWDREIILTGLADYYDKDVSFLLQDIERNYTDVRLIIICLRSFIVFIKHVDSLIDSKRNQQNQFSSIQGIWSDDITSWKHCNDISQCVNK